jgi:hypothetical protein
LSFLQMAEQVGRGAAFDIGHRHLDVLHRATVARADRGHRIAALGRLAVRIVEMHLDELSGQERKRRAIGTLEDHVTHARGEHATCA